MRTTTFSGAALSLALGLVLASPAHAGKETGPAPVLEGIGDVGAVPAGTPTDQLQVDISNNATATSCPAFGAQPGASEPTVVLNLGAGATITGFAWNTIQTAFGGSFRSEMAMQFYTSDGGNLLRLRPGVADTSPGGPTNYVSAGIIDLSDNMIPNIVLPADGNLTIGFCETFLDGEEPDGLFGAPSTLTVACFNCQAGAPEIGVSPTSLNLGDANVGTTSAAQSFTVSNTGTAEGDIAGISFTGPFARAASAGSCPTGGFTLADGESCTVNVVFQPVAAGAASGSASVDLGGVTGDAPTGVPATVVTLSGNGTAPSIGVSPTSLNFGNIVAGVTSAAQTVTFTNNGNGSGSVDSFSFSGGFSRSGGTCGTPPFALTPGQSCTVGVVFTAGVLGPVSGSFTANAGASVLTVTLAGASISPAPAFIPVDGGWALGLMIALIGLFAGIAVFRRQ